MHRTQVLYLEQCQIEISACRLICSLHSNRTNPKFRSPERFVRNSIRKTKLIIEIFVYPLRYTLWNSVLPKRNIDKAIQLISRRHRGFRVLIEESNSMHTFTVVATKSISVRLWFRPLCQIDRWMFAHCTGIERGLVYLSERAGESLTCLVSFTRVTYRPLSGVNIRSEGLLWQKRKPKCFDCARLIGRGPFFLVAVPLPPNWKETNSFVTVVVDDVSDSATFLNFLSTTSTSTQLSNNNGLVYARDKFSFRQILFYIFDLFSHAREPVVDYLLLFDPSETVQRLATVRKSVS